MPFLLGIFENTSPRRREGRTAQPSAATKKDHREGAKSAKFREVEELDIAGVTHRRAKILSKKQDLRRYQRSCAKEYKSDFAQLRVLRAFAVI
ncbi:MAG: hypothetical protein ABSB42_08580, partial [Tepidisphaeraceae bacterium]